ncbi:MAG TPA: YCF48-related protein [Ignavibacteriaceae bacterium]|nr:YCF48-related protein [Ignavibacteriaceae bacterium]
MKKFLLTFLICGAFTFFNAQNLEVMHRPDIKEFIRDISFVDATYGWMVGSKGVAYKSTDAGLTWTELSVGVTKDLYKVSFVDQNTGWTGAVDGSLYKTTDGGTTWIELSYESAVPNLGFSILDMLRFYDVNTGFIIAGKLRSIYLLKTTNGGETWAVKDSLVSATLLRRWYDITFNGNNGVLVGDKKEIQKYSTDFGETWTLSTPIADNFFRDLKYVKFLTDTDVIALGEGNEFSGVILPVYKSTDRGITWTKKSQSFAGIYDRVRGAYFKNSTHGIAVGSDGFSKAFVTKTSDGGETWSSTSLDYAFGFQALYGNGDFLFALGTSSHFVFSSDFGENWTLLNIKGVSSIIALQFVNNMGFAVSRNSDIYFNADGKGDSWNVLSSAGKNLAGGMVVTPNHSMFILKENRHIVKSTDYGITWRTVSQPVNPNARNLVGGIDFAGNTTGYAFFSMDDYSNYYIFKSTDEGETWAQSVMVSGPGSISGDMVVFDSDNAVALAPNLWTLRTSDGGQNWAPATLVNFPAWMSSSDFKEVSKIDENRAVAIGEKFICITSDKGATWNFVNHGIADIDSIFYRTSFRGDSIGYVALYNAGILKTTDFGNSWTYDATFADSFLIFSVGISETGKLFLGTSNGYILGERTIVGIKENLNPNDFTLNQNYPNPFNPSTKIEFILEKKQQISVIVYDVLGREVTKLFEGVKNEGAHTITFSANQLSSGVYFYSLKGSAGTLTRKMLLAK